MSVCLSVHISQPLFTENIRNSILRTALRFSYKKNKTEFGVFKNTTFFFALKTFYKHELYA